MKTFTIAVLVLGLGSVAAHASSGVALQNVARSLSEPTQPMAPVTVPVTPDPSQSPGPAAPCAEISTQMQSHIQKQKDLDTSVLNNHRTIAGWMYQWDSQLWGINNTVLRYNGSIGSAGNEVTRAADAIQQEQANMQNEMQSLANCVKTLEAGQTLK